jgi:hypothetical protein
MKTMIFKKRIKLKSCRNFFFFLKLFIKKVMLNQQHILSQYQELLGKLFVPLQVLLRKKKSRARAGPMKDLQ